MAKWQSSANNTSQLFFSTEIFSQLVDGTENEAQHQTNVGQIMNQLEPELVQMALDQYIRPLLPAEWHWKSVQKRVEVITELQLLCAQFLRKFYQLFMLLESQSPRKVGGEENCMGKTSGEESILRSTIGMFTDYCSRWENKWNSGNSGEAPCH